jgi:PKD repeat protein
MINFKMPKLFAMHRILRYKTTAVFTFYFLLFTFYGKAQQTWQWGKSGGSSSTSTNTNRERVRDIATDKWGNSYFLATAYQAGMHVDGNSLTGFGSSDIIMSSFDCEGNYRWGKVLGTSSNGNDFHHIETDTLGGVYITGYMFITNMYTANIDIDTTVANTNKSMFLIKYDTGGAYNWLRMPQADTVSVFSYSSTGPLELDVDGGGNIYWLCQLPPGAYANGAYVVNTPGAYMLRYDSQGIFQSAFPIDMQATGTAFGNIRMKRDHASGRLYLSGYLPTSGNMTIGGNLVTHEMYAAGFNNQGQHLWTEEGSVIGYSRFLARPDVDDSGYVYMAGISTHGDNFAGHNVVNTISTANNPVPFIVKLDSNGNLMWGRNASANSDTYCEALILCNNATIAIAGEYAGTYQWPGWSGPNPNHIPNQNVDVFVTRFDCHTGTVLNNDTLGSNFGVSDEATAIASDHEGNVIVGGQFEGDLYAGTADTLYNMGGETDFFIAKYGYPCGCTVPTADLNYTLSGWNGSFTYTGTGQHDSLRWYFGDGGSSTQTNPNHSYTANGSYTVCVTAYNACDSNQYCETIQVSVGVNTLAGIDNITVYPNPAKELLQLKGLIEATQYRLLSVTGTVMQQGRLEPNNNGISTKDLAPGMYLLELSNTKQQGVVRIVRTGIGGD